MALGSGGSGADSPLVFLFWAPLALSVRAGWRCFGGWAGCRASELGFILFRYLVASQSELIGRGCRWDSP